MDCASFANALAADPAARVFVDCFGLANTAHLVNGAWIGHTRSNEPGVAISEDRLFDANNRLGWQAEQSRISAHYFRELVDVLLPEAPRLADEAHINLQGEIETQPIYGDRVVTMSRDDVAAFLVAHPGAVELE